MHQSNNPTPFALTAETPKAPKQKPVKRERRETKDEARKYQQMARQLPPASKEETAFRHSNWATKRKLVRAALESVNTSRCSMERFDECGGECTVEYCKESQKYRLRANYCKNRHCEPCNRAKANLLAANLRSRLEKEPNGRYRFVTLTLKHTDTPLADQIQRLYTSFRTLRTKRPWKESQSGGAAVLEVKWDPDTGEWHPHLHIISEGDFLLQSQLAELWHAITGDSWIVDIRPLKTGKDAAHYVAKYVSKGTNDAVWHNTNAAQEWVTAMKGVRSCATFGAWRGYKLLAHLPDTAAWTPIGTLNSIYRDAREGHVYAVRLLEVLARELQYDPHRKRGHATPAPA